MKRLAFLLVVPLAIVAAIVVARARTPAPGPEDAARASLGELLDGFPPPPEAREVDSAPGLEGSGSAIRSKNYVHLQRAWVTPESVDEVLAWAVHHHPPHTEGIGTGSSGGAGRTIDRRVFYIGGESSSARARSLEISVTADGGETSVRAQAKGVWIEPRQAAERIPDDVGLVEVERTHRHGGHPETAVLRGAEAERIVALVNGFGIVQPGETSCLQIRPKVDFHLSFRRAADDPALAEADFAWPMSNCEFLELRLPGKGRQPALEEAWVLHRNLVPLLSGK
jgi:hypothetical protein